MSCHFDNWDHHSIRDETFETIEQLVSIPLLNSPESTNRR